MTSEWLLLKEVQELARAPSVSTVRHWIATGRLPSIKPGRRRLVRRADLERFLEQSGETHTAPDAIRESSVLPPGGNG